MRASDDVAIAGLGQTIFSKKSGRSELSLAAEAICAALTDARLTPRDVDGLATLEMDSSQPNDVANALQLGALTFWSTTTFGGAGACAAIDDAARAVADGIADCVVVYRSLNGRSGARFGSPTGTVVKGPNAFTVPYGLIAPGQLLALNASRYMHEFSLTNLDLAPVSVAARHYASTNPNAIYFERPITVDDHQSSPWVAEPVLRRLDCCMESDGAVAMVITTGSRARDLEQSPVYIRAAARSLSTPNGGMARDYHRSSILSLPDTEFVGKQLWQQSSLRPQDVQAAIIYDHFSPFVVRQLEALGFCELGEGASFVAEQGIGIDGALPVNPHGGQLGEAYVHGMNGIGEAVRQLRGSAANQVADVQNVVVTSGAVQATSGLILRNE